jgi:LCP family protein required for cell wall assembly
VTLGALLLVVVAVVVGVGVILPARLDANIERIEDPFAALPTRPPAPTPSPGASGQDVPMNVLVLGSDSRISAGDPSSWEQGAQRTDVMMLVHLPADRDSAQVMSIPRDSWVDIPGWGEAKLNAAYSFGGPTLLIQTIEQLTGVRIDHFALTDFVSFATITDALGGVPITLREDLEVGGEVLGPGEHVMTGEQALTYVRQRYELSRGDFDRVQRQQAWMRAIMAKVRTEGVLLNPTRVYGFLDAVSRSIAVDEGLTLDAMRDLLLQVRNLTAADIDFFTVPIAGTGRSDDGQSIVNLNRSAFDELMAAVREDRVREYLDEHGDDVDRLPAVAP